MLWFLLSAFGAAPQRADAIAAGDCAKLISLTDPFEAQDEGWRVPRGWCLLKLGDAEGADAILSHPTDGVLGEYGRLILARARLEKGDFEGAETALAGLQLPGSAGEEVQLTRARLAARRGDLKAFQALATGLDGPEIDFLRAEVRFANDDPQGAWEQWRAVWVHAAVGGWDAKAAARLATTQGPEFTPSDRAKRLTRLRKSGRIDEAADLAAELGTSTNNPIELARVNLSARKYADSLVHWERALGAPAKATGSPRNLFDYALTHARSGDYKTAAVVYQRLIAQHPSDSRADFASYKLGYMAYDKNDCERAIALYAAHIKRYPSSKHLDEALWFTARCQWRTGNIDAAVGSWKSLVSQRPRSSLVPGATYWQARALGRGGNANGERAALERVLRSWPSSGYAWFAAARLGHRFEPRAAVARPAWPEDWATDRAVIRAEALLAVGFRDWARAELQPIRSRIAGRDATLAAAWAFIAAGDYRAGKALAKPYCVSPWKGGDPVAQQACTPRPESGIVSAVAKRFDLDPLLPYGIMTAESALDPSVTSVAGARGLMQLMPKEGPRIHAELYPDRPYDADDLYSAPYNASMGTAELGLKRQSLAGVLQTTDLPAVIASYNGGETAVRRWLEAYDSPPEFDEFSEDVGYTETRKYVKRVLGFEMAYRWVYGDPQ